MTADLIAKWEAWISRQGVKLREILPSNVKHRLEDVASLGIVIRARKAVKFALVVCVIVWFSLFYSWV